MSSSQAWDKISLLTIRRAIKDYPNQLKSGLAELDKARFTTIPTVLQQRRKDGNVNLTRTETTSLVEWKLKHGTFRPRLLSLVSSNEEALIQSTTGKAYTLYDDHRDGSIPTDALDTLTALKGIGPATASLLLAVYDPVAAPFFSDELFRWLTGADATSAGKPQGWDKKIGYTKKEYKELWERVTQLRHRIEGVGGGEDGVTATDLEKAAYVIARWHISGGEPEASGTRNAKRPREVDDGAEEAVEEKLARRKSARSK